MYSRNPRAALDAEATPRLTGTEELSAASNGVATCIGSYLVAQRLRNGTHHAVGRAIGEDVAVRPDSEVNEDAHTPQPASHECPRPFWGAERRVRRRFCIGTRSAQQAGRRDPERK